MAFKVEFAVMLQKAESAVFPNSKSFLSKNLISGYPNSLYDVKILEYPLKKSRLSQRITLGSSIGFSVSRYISMEYRNEIKSIS